MRVSGSFCARCGARLGPGAYFCPRCGTGIPVAPANAPTVATAPPPPHDAGREALLDALRQAALGEYEILAELGRGGMATVYLAHDVALDRKVAIKVLAPALLQMGEGMVERFKREARTAAALSHPHIIPIYAVKESERVLYFVMKYVQGRPLDSVLRDVGALPIPMVQAIIAQVGDALGYAHRHGVIHRDIKSANIMLDEEGWAVVTDFGIAKVVQAEGLTVTGVTVGTPTYMSPEQCETREVTGASDQYSLGIVAYEMLTGRLPFQAESTMAVMYAHFNERPRPVTERRPDCPANLAAAVMRMLAKDPAGRWPSMDDVIAVCGRPSLRHDDPVRGEMITLARAGGRSPALAHIKTPTSPLALSKSQTHPAPVAAPSRHGGPRLWWALGAGAGAVVVAAALWWAGPWRTATPRDTGAAAGPARAPAETSVVAAPPPPPALPATPTQTKRPAAPQTAPGAAAGASPGGPAGGDQGPAGRLCASAGIARRQRSSPGVSRVDRRGARDVQAVLPVGPRAQGGADDQPVGRRGQLGGRHCERRVRVCRAQDRQEQGGHHHIPGDAGARLHRLAPQLDPLPALAPAQKLYSRPAVHSTLGRSPPRFSGNSVLATSVIPEPVVNLKPNEPLITSSRSLGRFVTSIVRRNGAS